MIGAFKNIRRRLVDRSRTRPGRRVRLLASMQTQRVKAKGFYLAHFILLRQHGGQGMKSVSLEVLVRRENYFGMSSIRFPTKWLAFWLRVSSYEVTPTKGLDI